MVALGTADNSALWVYESVALGRVVGVGAEIVVAVGAPAGDVAFESAVFAAFAAFAAFFAALRSSFDSLCSASTSVTARVSVVEGVFGFLFLSFFFSFFSFVLPFIAGTSESCITTSLADFSMFFDRFSDLSFFVFFVFFPTAAAAASTSSIVRLDITAGSCMVSRGAELENFAKLWHKVWVSLDWIYKGCVTADRHQLFPTAGHSNPASEPKSFSLNRAGVSFSKHGSYLNMAIPRPGFVKVDFELSFGYCFLIPPFIVLGTPIVVY